MFRLQHQSTICAIVSSCAFALAAAACSDATAPARVRSTFAIVPGGGAYPPSTPIVQATATTITVDGTLVTADPCFTVTGSASTSNDTLVVRIVGTDENVPCVQSLGMWHYVLTVQPRPGGVDAIRVEHDGGKGSSVVLEQALL